MNRSNGVSDGHQRRLQNCNCEVEHQNGLFCVQNDDQ
jgi:hypothetical protein